MSNPDTTRIFNYPEVTTPASDAKILLDSQTAGSKCIDANLFRCDLIDKTITQRGTFEASEDDADGFKKVVVDIPYTDIHVASGPIATFEGEDLPLKSLTASIEPVQAGSGDPSPSNDRPISGHTEANVPRCGKNVFGGLPMAENIVEVGRNATLDTTNKTVTFTSSAPKDGSYERSISEGFKFKENTIYTFVATYSNSGNNSSLRFRSTTGRNQEIQLANTNGQKTKIAVTTWEDYSLKDIILSFYSASSTTLYYEESGLFEGVITADDFEPYNGQTYNIPFTDGQGQSVEVFGGSVDVVNGGGKSNLAYIELPSTGWAQEGDYTGVFTNYAVKAYTPYPQLICSHAVRAVSYNDAINNEGKIGLSSSRVLWHTTFTTVEELEQYLANNTVQIAYELATPTTFYTQPTSIKSLDGENNVSASTGDVDVEYQTVWVRPTE